MKKNNVSESFYVCQRNKTTTPHWVEFGITFSFIDKDNKNDYMPNLSLAFMIFLTIFSVRLF